MISARKASRKLRLNYSILKNAIEANPPLIQYQAKIQDDSESRPSYGFAIDYIEEVGTILDNHRKPGQTVLTEEVRERLLDLNKKWRPERKFDGEEDIKKTRKIIKKLS